MQVAGSLRWCEVVSCRKVWVGGGFGGRMLSAVERFWWWGGVSCEEISEVERFWR